WPDRRLSGARRWNLRMIDQHEVNLLRRLGDVEDGIADPVDAGDFLVVELDLFPQRAGNSLQDVTLDALLKTVRIDDLAAVVRDSETLGEDLAGGAIDVHLRDHRDPRSVALRIGDAAPAHLGAALALARRRPRIPAELLRRRLDHRDVARLLDVTQTEFDRIQIKRSCHLVHERLTREVDLRPDRIA